MNDNKHRGVTYKEEQNKWTSTITFNKKTAFLGSYDTKEEAIERRLQAEKDMEEGVFKKPKFTIDRTDSKLNKSITNFGNKFQVSLAFYGRKRLYVGLYSTIEEARIARDLKIKELDIKEIPRLERTSENKYIVMKGMSYQVFFCIGKKRHYVGIYPTIEEARIARDLKVNELNSNIKDKEDKISLTKDKSTVYFANIEMYKEVLYSKVRGILSPKLFEGFQLIVKNVSRKFRYTYHSDREDCEAYALEMLLKNWIHFDEDRFDNVFAYYTEITKRAFAMQFKIIMKGRIDTISYDAIFSDGGEINI